MSTAQVNPGEFTKRIVIERLTREYDSDGYFTEVWDTYHECWAKFSQQSGTELIRANAEIGDVDVRFLIRCTPKKIDRKMRVLYKSEPYEIEYINSYGDTRQYTEIWCRRRTQEEQ